MRLPRIDGFGGVYKRTDPDGRVRFIASIRDRSNKRRQPTFATAREASDALYKAHREWPGRGASRVDYTIGQMVSEYLEHREGEYAAGRTCGGPACRPGRIADTTIEGDRAATAAIISGLGSRQADDPAARRAITRWLAAEERSGDRRSKIPGPLSTRAVALRASMLRRAYQYAIDDLEVLDGLNDPPVPRVNVRYEGGGRAISPAALQTLRTATPEHWRPMVDVLICSGMRIGEVCALNVSDFDPAAGTVRGGNKTDAGRNRVIKLPTWAVADLVHMLMRRYDGTTADPHDPLFVNTRGGRVGPDPFRRRVWQPAARRAGLDGVNPHSMRHTLATRAAESGMPIWDMMRHFGWADGRQARTYVHLAGDGVQAIADLMEKHR